MPPRCVTEENVSSVDLRSTAFFLPKAVQAGSRPAGEPFRLGPTRGR